MRNNKMDNIRVFLIFCVVFGHFLELCLPSGTTIYEIIYTFHIPAFVFISGYFARFDKRRIAVNLIYPYVLFQFLYNLFDACVLNRDTEALSALQYTTPYWLLWYLMAMIFYYLLLPMMCTPRENNIALLMLACILSLAAGFDRTIGRYLTLSRFFVFLPYFTLGVVLRRASLESLLKRKLLRVATAVTAAAVCVLCKARPFSYEILYGVSSYAVEGYSLMGRIFLLAIGINWIFLFLCWFPDKKIPLLSSVGKYTLIPYLAHGFLKLFWRSYGGPFIYSGYVNVAVAALLSVCIILIFGNRYVGGALDLVFTGKGLELLWQRMYRSKK